MIAYAILAAVSLFISGQALVGQLQESATAHRASAFLHNDVTDGNGDTVGTVSDVVTDAQGHVSYVIIEEPGAPAHFLPVPASALHAITAKAANTIRLGMDKKELADAPRFASGDWPDFRDREYETRVQQFYTAAESEPRPRM